MAVLLGVLVAASFGSGDFLGGRASRRAPTLTVLMVAQATAVLGAIVVCVFVSARVGVHDIVFGALAGSINIVGIGLLYQGLVRRPDGSGRAADRARERGVAGRLGSRER